LQICVCIALELRRNEREKVVGASG
jgi:hypothetical protein